MKVPTRVALGSGLLVLLLAAVTASQARSIARLAAMQQEIGETTLPSTAMALDLVAARDRLDLHLLKFAATGDPAYAEKIAEATESFDRDLQNLRSVRQSADDDADVVALHRAWQSFPPARATGPDRVQLLVNADREQMLRVFGEPLDDVREHLVAIVDAARARADHRVEAASDAAAHARNLAIITFVFSFLLAAAVTLVTVQSIRRPLLRLTRATEAIAAGEFEHRVTAEGSDEFSRLAEQFNRMAARLAELDRLKSDFLSNMSHEIKTPLAAMAETSTLLLDGVAGPLTARQQRLLELQRDNEVRLQTMIGDILDLSRLEAGVLDYHFDAHEIRSILETVRGQVEALARKYEVSLELDIRDPVPAVFCDRDRTLQVFHNLLSNAIRVSPRRSTVTLSAAGRSGPEGRWIRCEVRDQGPGVADEDKPRLFERFHRRSGHHARDRSGVGLGLAICREIVTAHGGRIGVEDAPGGGAVFVVELAAAQDQADRGSRTAVSGA